jgi:hypothetical protein
MLEPKPTIAAPGPGANVYRCLASYSSKRLDQPHGHAAGQKGRNAVGVPNNGELLNRDNLPDENGVGCPGRLAGRPCAHAGAGVSVRRNRAQNEHDGSDRRQAESHGDVLRRY